MDVKKDLKKTLDYKKGLFRGLVIFKLGEKEFCIDLKYVVAILKQDSSIDFPNLTLSDNEIFIFNEKVISIINIHKYFGLELKSLSPFSRIIVVDFDNLYCGFIIDNIIEMMTISEEILMDSFIEDRKLSKSFIKGIFKFDKRKIYYPDFDKLISEIAATEI